MNELDRRKILACANSACPFRVHPEAHLGGFCCTSCYSAWIAGLPVVHGPRCHQSKAAHWLPRAPPQPPGPSGSAGTAIAAISPAVSPARPILAPMAIPALPRAATPKIIPGRKRPAETPPAPWPVSRAKASPGVGAGAGHVLGTVPKARGMPMQNGMQNGWKMWTNGCGWEMEHPAEDFWGGNPMDEHIGLYEDQLEDHQHGFETSAEGFSVEPSVDPWGFPQVPAAPAPPARGVLIRPARRPEAEVKEDEVDPAMAAVLGQLDPEPEVPAAPAPPARGVLLRPARRPEAEVKEDEVDPALAAVLGLQLDPEPEPPEALEVPEAELSSGSEQLFPEVDPVAKTSVASSSLDYPGLREEAVTRADAAVNVGLARLADAKYLRRNFRKRPPCGFAFVPEPGPEPGADLQSVCRRCLCVSNPFGTLPPPPEPPPPPMEEAHVAAAIDMDAEMAKLLAEINATATAEAEPTPDIPLRRVPLTAPLNGTLL